MALAALNYYKFHIHKMIDTMSPLAIDRDYSTKSINFFQKKKQCIGTACIMFDIGTMNFLSMHVVWSIVQRFHKLLDFIISNIINLWD